VPGVSGGVRSVTADAQDLASRAAEPFAPISWHDLIFAASEPFVLPAEWRAALVRIFAYLGALFALSILAAELVSPRPVPEAAEPAPRPAWIAVEHPWPAFELSAPGFGEEAHYSIHRHAEGYARKDVLSFGELGKTQRYLGIEIHRAGPEAPAFEGPAEAMRAIGAEQGRVVGLRGTMPIASKFGPFGAYEFAIGPFGGYHCIGFLRSFDNPRVQIGGMSCSMNLVLDRKAISCALDRLTLLSAGSDPDIARLFAQAELKRTFCGQRDPLMYATPKRAGGGDVTHSVRLRGRLEH
jgi:hypothetical protein